MSEQQQPRVGIIGAGGIGKTHARAWRDNGVMPVAVADVNGEAAERLAGEIGATGWDDPAAKLAAGDLDNASICTPPATHAPLVEAAISAGLAVLCEKPLADSLAAAEKIASMSRPTAEMAKLAVNRAFETPLSEGMNVERDLFRATFALEDRAEGMAAFIEKRKPNNKNR
jgi:predicted dehydrogenase